jgi:hypothetical protein
LTIDSTPLPVVWAPVMAGADGILGAAGLEEKSLIIDFQRNRVAIAPSVDLSLRNNSTRMHAKRLPHGLLGLETEVSGVRVHAVIDTGSERSLGNVALRDALSSQWKAKQGPAPLALVTLVYGATKDVERGEIRIAPTIVMDTIRINNVAMVFGDFHIFKVWDLWQEPAMVIGMDVLGTVASLGIDFSNAAVYVTSVQKGTFTPTEMNALGSTQNKR